MSDSNAPPLRPHVFVGSSSGKGLPIANALQVNLEHDADVVIWSQGVFGLGTGTLEELVNQLPKFDFAILVLTPDDTTDSRETTSQSPRDNVIFELGLFIGGLGRTRTFIVHEDGAPLKLPTDLAGVTTARFRMHASGNLQSSLGGCCTRIKDAMKQQGTRHPSAPQVPTSSPTAQPEPIPRLQLKLLQALGGNQGNVQAAEGLGSVLGLRVDRVLVHLEHLISRGFVLRTPWPDGWLFMATTQGMDYLEEIGFP